MAKLILRAKSKNNYTVETKIIDVDNKLTNDKKVELIISPINNNTVDAKDFISGSLPDIISSITYYNTGSAGSTLNKVTAVITFNNQQVTGIVNISLPISGLSRSIEATLLLTDITNIDENIFVDSTPVGIVNSTDITKGSKTYKISPSGAGFKRVLVKKFSLPYGYLFQQEPTYSVVGSGYKVSVNSVKNPEGKVIEKTFEIFYNFPEQNPTGQIINSIAFSASSQKIATEDPLVATTEDEYKIYNVDLGRKIGTEGGIKNITINGVPGTKFKILVQDVNKKLYDFKGGGFQTNAKRGFLEGTIPPAIPGFGFGTYNAFVKINPSSTANTITTKIQTLAPTKITDELGNKKIIVPESISETLEADVTLTVQCEAVMSGTNRYSISRPLLESELNDLTDAQVAAGLITDSGGDGDDATYAVTSKSNSSIGTFVASNPIRHIYPDVEMIKYTWIISTTTDGYFLNILRKPRFSQGKTYVEWDDSFYSGDTGGTNQLGATGLPEKIYNSTGTAINTDVRILQGGSTYTGTDWAISGSFSVSPSEGSETHQDSDGNMLYSQVVISLNSLSGTFGDEALNIRLNLDNFLRIKQNS